MPLYDYLCGACGARPTLLVKRDAEAPACPDCGVTKLAKQLAPCAFTGFAKAPSHAMKTSSHKVAEAPHVHGASCGCGPTSQAAVAPTACPTASYADALVKKHLGP